MAEGKISWDSRHRLFCKIHAMKFSTLRKFLSAAAKNTGRAHSGIRLTYLKARHENEVIRKFVNFIFTRYC